MQPLRLALAAAVAALTLVLGPVSYGQNVPQAQDKPSQQPGDAFGVEVQLQEQTIVYLQGTGNWDSAYETIVDAFKAVNGYLKAQGIKPSGPPMTIYTQTDDTSFSFQAAVPVAQPPKNPPKGDLAVGQSPSGRAFKFVHRGSYDAMEMTFEAISNFLDEKQLDPKDLFLEQYTTDPVTTAEDKLVIEIYVPVK